jgi:hypothetical protein
MVGQRGAPSAQPAEPPSIAGPPAPFGPTLALTVTLALACFAVALGVVMLLTTPVKLPAFHTEENQRAESTLYVLAFAVILPLALIVVPRLADRIAARTNADVVSLLTALLVVTLAASILITRVLPGGGGVVEALAVVGIWWVGAAALLERARQGRVWRKLLGATDLVPYLWVLAGALVLAALLAFTSLASISALPLVLGAVAVPAGLRVYARRPGLPRVSRRSGIAIDAAIVVVLLLAIPNLVIFGPGPPLGLFTNSVIQFHHDLWLGPVNEVLAGHALLVGIGAQYGIAPIYLLAGWFQLAPIGYGTLGFLDGVLFALLFAASYCLLRIAGTTRLLAAGALAFAVIVLVWNMEFSVGSLPQHGPLRFGLPMILILAAAVEARWPPRARAARAAQLMVVALASIWAFEAFTYTLFTFAAIVCFQAWMRRGPGRLAWLARRAALAAAACVAAQLIFVAATLVFTGELPDYGWYLGYLHEFLLGKLAEITYDFSRWSAGLAVGAAYATSAAAFVLLVRRRRDIAERERTTLVALCGTTAYGIALFTYFVDRSPDHVLPYVSLPALLAGTLWLSLLLRRGVVESRSARLGGLAFSLSLAIMLLSVAWSSIGARFDQSALAHVIPGGESLRGALHRLWHPPPLDLLAPAGERLVETYMPNQHHVTIVTSPDLATEILLRSGRSNQLAFSDPLEDSFVPSRALPALRQTVAELRPGDRILLQGPGLKAFTALETQPSRDVLHNPVPGPALLPIQEWVLQRIAKRFELRVIHRDKQGFVVAALVGGR